MTNSIQETKDDIRNDILKRLNDAAQAGITEIPSPALLGEYIEVQKLYDDVINELKSESIITQKPTGLGIDNRLGDLVLI